MIFVDANIPMYLVGSDDARRLAAQTVLERLAAERKRLVTDAEVFQEILHRFLSINRRDAIEPTFRVLRDVVDEVFAIELRDVERARDVSAEARRFSARDAIHVAILERYGIERILTFDTAFDGYPGLIRIT